MCRHRPVETRSHLSAYVSVVQRLVVAPIEKMVNIVKQLADDPLRQPSTETAEEEADKQKNSNQLETSMLETTILKIGGLLQVKAGNRSGSSR